jgi:hypothetical protein
VKARWRFVVLLQHRLIAPAGNGGAQLHRQIKKPQAEAWGFSINGSALVGAQKW